MLNVEPSHPSASTAPDPLVLDLDEKLEWVPVPLIQLREGHNPRRYFDPAKMDELIASVRRQGVIQPIVVRPAAGGLYELIAGERRWRAAKAAGLDEIKAVVRDVDALAAAEIAMVENTVRDDLMPSEEAQKGRDMLTLCGGDIEEARNRLGWTRQRMDARLALLHCIEAVLDALDCRRISLGHGELLATLPPETQAGTLASILDKGITVAQLREKIGQIARPLDAAFFDLAGCAQCAQNSSTQADLFGESIGKGRCSSPKCYGEKTLAALNAQKVTLAETYACVALDVERTPGSFAVLEIDGARGVGRVQFEQGCRACSQFGVLVCTQPGREGQLTEDVCFGPETCRAGKIEAHAEHLRADASASASADAGPAKSGKGQTEAKKREQPAPSVAKTPQGVTDAIDAGLREVAGMLAFEEARVMKAVTLYALWRDADYPNGAATGCAALDALTRTRSKDIPVLMALDANTCTHLETVLAVHVLSGTTQTSESASVAAAVIAATDTDVRGRFVVNAALLKAHRKAGMIALLEEAGFSAWYNAKHGADAFARLAQGKIGAIIEAALDPDGFDWSSVVPGIVTARLKALKR